MKPEPVALSTLAAVIQHDLAALKRMDGQLESLAPALQTPDTDFRDVAASAFILHNLYNALENSFEHVSRTFENQVKDMAQWHRELQNKMFLEIPGVRPQVLPENLRNCVNQLRGFRHVFRHGYDFELEPKRLLDLIALWRADKSSLFQALERFIHYLLAEAGMP